MLKVEDKVVVLHNGKNMLGLASVVDVCDDHEKLENYFKSDHPQLLFYKFAIQNKENIYIVDFENDLGQAGYLRKNLKKL